MLTISANGLCIGDGADFDAEKQTLINHKYI